MYAGRNFVSVCHKMSGMFRGPQEVELLDQPRSSFLYLLPDLISKVSQGPRWIATSVTLLSYQLIPWCFLVVIIGPACFG